MGDSCWFKYVLLRLVSSKNRLRKRLVLLIIWCRVLNVAFTSAWQLTNRGFGDVILMSATRSVTLCVVGFQALRPSSGRLRRLLFLFSRIFVWTLQVENRASRPRFLRRAFVRRSLLSMAPGRPQWCSLLRRSSRMKQFPARY